MQPLLGQLRGRLLVLGFIVFILVYASGCSGTSSGSSAKNTGPVQFSESSLPNAAVGSAYSTTLMVTGGAAPYSFTVASGALPLGFSLSSSTGVLGGTPIASGQFSFTVQVSDSSAPPQTAKAPFSISVSSGNRLVISTAALPNGTVGSGYSSTLTATGGTAPYSWTVASGSLPAGLSMSKNGAISGTPSSAGQFNFTVQVADSSSPVQKASKTFDLSILSTLAITGTIQANAVNGRPYSSTDQASGGVPAYTWSVSSGVLPPGLNLAATTGTISGTPNQDGTYNFTLKVVDSGSPQQNATQVDTITVATVTQDAWTLQPTQLGWYFVSPNKVVTCKYNAVSKVDDTDLQSAGTDAEVLAKYGGSWNTWAAQQSARLSSLGFTAAGLYSYRYAQKAPANALPFVPTIDTSGYANLDNGSPVGTNYHIKDADRIVNKSGMICGGAIYTSVSIDPYDPGAQNAFNGIMTYFSQQWGLNNAIFVVPDEADHLSLFDQYSYHADGGLVIAANNPMVSTSASGYSYPDHTYFAKEAMRDYLLNEYLCTSPGVPVPTCTGAGTGTGVADPSSGNYVGAGFAATSLTALNGAWGISYTTWNTSDAGGLAGITSGTYASWGTGTGFLDENGAHIISAAQQGNCSGSAGNGPSTVDAWSTKPQIKTDVEAFIAVLAANYASTMQIAWFGACGSNCAPLAVPVYDGPTYVYSAMAPYADLFWTGFGAIQDNLTVGNVVSRVQGIIDNSGGKPVVVADYMRADPDSWSQTSCSGNWGFDCQNTQALRGSTLVSLDQSVLPLKNPNGKFAVVGLEHWSLYDSFAEGKDFGLFTPNDNGYDGSASSTATSSGGCATNTNYAQPAICQDPNGNYEGLAVSSCISAGSKPTWNTNFNGYTHDGSCVWFNEGPYTPNPESTNWGNALGPIAKAFTAGICDR
jgi:Putative Ig domain